MKPSVKPDTKRRSSRSRQSEPAAYGSGSASTSLANADHAFALKGVDLPGGRTVTGSIDTEAGTLKIGDEGAGKGGKYAFAMQRIDEQGELNFEHYIKLSPGDTITFHYGDWNANDEGVTADVQSGGQSETVTLTDQK